MRHKIGSLLEDIIMVFTAVLILIILGIVLFSKISYSCQRTFLMPEIALLGIGCFFVIILCSIGNQVEKVYVSKEKLIYIFSLILFFSQIYIFYNIYFASNQWDPAAIITVARAIANGEVKKLDVWYSKYLSWFPNNQFIVYVFSILFKINDKFGVLDTENGLMLIIILQCFLSTSTGILVYKIILDIVKKSYIAWMGWGMYVVLIALSGWNVVTYTDMMGLIFPTLILRIYQKLNNTKRVWLKWLLLVSLAYWGFKIKPTAIIILIAIIVIEIIEILKSFQKEHVKKVVTALVVSSMCIFISSSIFDHMINSTGIILNKEASTGPLHMIMMGMNPENDGVWYLPDVELSEGIETKEERTRVQKEVIQQRLNDYGIAGFSRHMWKKTLIIFNDGSFAYGCEGGFFGIVYEDKNDLISPFLKSIYITSERNYNKLISIEQMVWLVCLCLSGGVVFIKKGKDELVITLSLLGIILFNFSFEARARYLMLYVPFFIIAACVVVNELSDRLTKRKKVLQCGFLDN